MTHEQMFRFAKWIDCPGGEESPIFRKSFSADKGEKALITICGLGFFEMKINGKKVSDDLLVPNASNYIERDMSNWSYPLYDKMSFRIYAVKYEITDFLLQGENVLTVMLGGGYFHQTKYRGEGDVSYGSPMLCFIISKESGEVISDSSTLCFPGYFERCNLYYGEYQNHLKKPVGFETAGYTGCDFSPSREVQTPESKFFYQTGPADKIAGVITDIRLIKEYDGKKLYDIGRNISGRVVVECAKRGEKLTVRHCEQIEGDHWWGIHFDDEKYIDEFICDGKQTEYTCVFGWQGFRYVEIEGDGVPVRAEIIHSDCPVTSSFTSDNEMLVWLYDTYIHTQLCNMHAGIPSDCPHRERLGYTGDGQLCCEAGMLMLGSKSFYKKWLYDIADCQDRFNGHVQHTAPLMGGGGGPCGWGGAIVEVPYKYYKIFGDRELCEEFFPKMLRFFDYIQSRCENGLVCREEEGGWCLGDWLPPQPIQVPETFVNTCLYIKYMKIVKEIAKLINREEQVKYLDERIAVSSKMLNAAYYSEQQRAFCGDVNGASAIALAAGLGNEKVRNKVIEKYGKTGQFDTGIIATLELIEYLFNTGENELAVRLLTNRGEASFYNMKKHGATTLWENWNGDSSQNHPMFGAVSKTLFTHILGIGQAKESCGFEKIVISPHLCESVARASGYVTIENMKIGVSYEKTGNKIHFAVDVPGDRQTEFVLGETRLAFCGSREFDIERATS
ncbi:MAG: family 78 glycoside hydrolase catalytic domain [Clostridiales bacterium]|nr:family 78 glycoside hydrolase catalytic domain [Clostridiales bacterium]